MPDPYKYGLVPEATDFLALFRGFRSGLDGGQRNGWNGADLHQVRPRLLLEHVLTVELHHAVLLLPVLLLRVARASLLLARVLGNAQAIEVVLLSGGDVLLAQHQRVRLRRQRYRLAAGEDLVLPVLLVPFGKSGGHVHLLDDVPPADSGIVGAERNLALLRGIGDDALLGAPEIVVK